jgi:origin recognition complex subunit 1
VHDAITQRWVQNTMTSQYILDLFLQDEIYYSIASSEILVPEIIVGRCTVSSEPPDDIEMKSTQAWSTSPNKRRKAEANDNDDDENSGEDKLFYCHLVVDSMRGLYYELNWDQHHQDALASVSVPPKNVVDTQWGSGSMWDVDIAGKPTRSANVRKRGKSPLRKKIKLMALSESESDAHGTEDEYEASDDGDDAEEDIPQDDTDEESGPSLKSYREAEPKTPSKKRRKRDITTPRSPSKRGTGTPRKPRTTKTLVHPTPHSKARRKGAAGSGPSSPRKRQFTMRPQTITYAAHDLSHLPQDPWLRAMHVLHVGSRPDALPCREEEFERVLRCVGELLEEGSGGCVCELFTFLFMVKCDLAAVMRQISRVSQALGRLLQYTLL